MKNNVLHKISNYINWSIKTYQIASKIQSSLSPLKLISLEKDNLGEVQFLIQFAGKNVFPKISIDSFIKDPTLISQFNQSDQAVISQYLNNIVQQKITCKIISRAYDRETKKFIFSIQISDQHNNVEKCVLIKDPSVLFHYLPWVEKEDAYLIGLEIGKHLN